MLLLTVGRGHGRAGADLSRQPSECPRPRSAGREPAILWTALAVGVLLKGPLILMFVGLTALTLSIADRSARWLWSLRPFAGLVWLVLLVLPWFIAIIAKSGDQFLCRGDRPRHARQGHQRSGSAWRAAGTLFCCCSGSRSGRARLLAGLAAPAMWRSRREPGARFLLAWLIPSWLIFEAVMTKLPHYVLPLYPAIAILIAGILECRRACRKRVGSCEGQSAGFFFPARLRWPCWLPSSWLVVTSV